MSADKGTPRTDAACKELGEEHQRNGVVDADFARQLETELQEMHREQDQVEHKLKLVEADRDHWHKASLSVQREQPIGWVVAVGEHDRMRVYGPQYRSRQDAEQDAALPMARGQKAEVWACYPVAALPVSQQKNDV